jgi:hypothetical protein
MKDGRREGGKFEDGIEEEDVEEWESGWKGGKGENLICKSKHGSGVQS